MAIRVPDLGLGDGKTGDTELKIRQDYNHNFNDQTNAASRLVGTANGQVPLVEQVPSLLGTAATKNVGTAAGNVMEVGAFGLGKRSSSYSVNIVMAADLKDNLLTKGSHFFRNDAINAATIQYGAGFFTTSNDTYFGMTAAYLGGQIRAFSGTVADAEVRVMDLWHDKNATKDPNGFLKGASPIAEIYSDKMDLNHDATQQGGITFKKLGIGDYLVKGSLGFAQEGWYIETPKDANGNVLVAVVYEQLANNDLSIKTYAKKFDDETGDIVANLLKPRDIPTGRFISLRLHELPKEPPVMPMDEQTTEV